MDLVAFFKDDPGNWFYLLIPFVAAFVGWITNVLALKMTFYPVEYYGLGPWIGWQGIIPSKAGTMAGKAVDLMLGKLIDMKEQFARIDPHEVARSSVVELERLSQKIIHKVMRAQAPLVWKLMPESAREELYRSVNEELPRVVGEMMADMQTQIDDLFDVRGMVVQTLLEDKRLLNEIFLRCGEKEFSFIERSGLYFGFLFGLIQMVVWYLYPAWWILPLAGLLVGYATNWLAIRLIFQPLRPRRIGPWTVQGIFIKRQREVAAEYARIVSSRVLNSRNIFDSMLYGKTHERLAELISSRVDEVVDKGAGSSQPFVELVAGRERMRIVRNIVQYHFLDHFPIIIHQISPYTEAALDLENTFRERMANLDAAEFQGFLRPVFQEDELKLILVGAALGAAAGFAQLYFLF